MILAQELGGFTKDDFIYPFHTHIDFIDKVCSYKDRNYVIDELGHLFPYKQSMKTELGAAFSAIEVARKNRNILIGCCRDIMRIYNNYRNGKVQIVIFLIDRYPNEKLTEGVVLLGNPFFESEDKFFLSTIIPSYDYNFMRAQLERLPSFIGYIFFEDIKKYGITKKQIDEYESFKDEGIASVAKQQKDRIVHKINERTAVDKKAEKKQMRLE